jgi:hypothetical protein
MSTSSNDDIFGIISLSGDFPSSLAFELTEVASPNGERKGTARSGRWSAITSRRARRSNPDEPAIEIMPCSFDHNSYIPVGCPLHSLRHLTLICSIDDIRRKPTKAAALRLQESTHASGQARIVSKQRRANRLRQILVEDA